MGDIKIQPGTSGSGIYTIQSGSGDTDRTITLPNVADATLISSNDSQTISTAMLADSVITTDKVADANITPAKLNGAQSGDAPIYGIRAWVTFNGEGTVAIFDDGNVSSITDNGTGKYTVNFETAMPHANYSISGVAQHNTNAAYAGDKRENNFSLAKGVVPTTSGVRIVSMDNPNFSSNYEDGSRVTVMIIC